MKLIALVLTLILIAPNAYAIDLTIQDIPTQAQADKILDSALRIIDQTEEKISKKLSNDERTAFENKIDAIRVKNGLKKKYDPALVEPIVA